MNKLLLAASAFALIPTAASAQLLGGPGLLGTGNIGGTLNSTVDTTTRTVRGTVDGNGSTSGEQSVDARRDVRSAVGGGCRNHRLDDRVGERRANFGAVGGG